LLVYQKSVDFADAVCTATEQSQRGYYRSSKNHGTHGTHRRQKTTWRWLLKFDGPLSSWRTVVENDGTPNLCPPVVLTPHRSVLSCHYFQSLRDLPY
ncbi:MAG: hypothetical protein MUD03_16385, partial [Pirellula sp.]|nr:hypothetical protein [Pirellula sp.]